MLASSSDVGDVGELTSTELELALTFFALYGGIVRSEMSILQALQEFDVALPPVAVVNRMLALAAEGRVACLDEQYRALPKGRSFYRRRSTAATSPSTGPANDLGCIEHALVATATMDAPGMLDASPSSQQRLLSKVLSQEEWVSLLRALKRSYVFAQEEHQSGLVEERDSFAAIASLTVSQRRSRGHRDKQDGAMDGDNALDCASSSADSSSDSSGDGNGDEDKRSIEAAKLQRLCANFGLTFDVDAFISALDENGDGSVDFKEFLALVSSSDDALESYLPSFVACGGREECVTAEGVVKPPSASTASDQTALLLTVRDLFRSLPYLPVHLVEEVPPKKHVRGVASFRAQRAAARRDTVTMQQRRLMQAFGRSAIRNNTATTPRPRGGDVVVPAATANGRAPPSTTAHSSKKAATLPFDCDPAYVTLQRYAKIMFRWGKRPRELNVYLQDRLTRRAMESVAAAASTAEGAQRDGHTNNHPMQDQPAMQLLVRACRDIDTDANGDGNDSVNHRGGATIHAHDDALTGVRDHQKAAHQCDEHGDPLKSLRLEGNVIGSKVVSMMAEAALTKHHQRVAQHLTNNAQAVLRFEAIAAPSRMPRFSPQRGEEGRAPLHAPRRMCTPPTHKHVLPPSSPATTAAGGGSASTAFARSTHIATASSPRPAPPDSRSSGRRHVRGDRGSSSTDGFNPVAALFREEATPTQAFKANSVRLASTSQCRSTAAGLRAGDAAGSTSSTIANATAAAPPPPSPSWWAKMRATLMDRRQLVHDTRTHMAHMAQWARSSSSAGLTTTASGTPLSMAPSSPSVALTQMLASSSMGHPVAPNRAVGGSTWHSRPASKRDESSQLLGEPEDNADLEVREATAQRPPPASIHVPSRPNTAGRARVVHEPPPVAQRTSPSPVLVARRSPPLIAAMAQPPAQSLGGSRKPKPRPPQERQVRGRRNKPSKGPVVQAQPERAMPAAQPKEEIVHEAQQRVVSAAPPANRSPRCSVVMATSDHSQEHDTIASPRSVADGHLFSSRKLSIDSVREGSTTYDMPQYPPVWTADATAQRQGSQDHLQHQQQATLQMEASKASDAVRQRAAARRVQEWYRKRRQRAVLAQRRTAAALLLQRAGRGGRLRLRMHNARNGLLLQQQREQTSSRVLASTPQLQPTARGSTATPCVPSAEATTRAVLVLQRVGRGLMCRWLHLYELKCAQERLEEETLLDGEWLLDTRVQTTAQAHGAPAGEDGIRVHDNGEGPGVSMPTQFSLLGGLPTEILASLGFLARPPNSNACDERQSAQGGAPVASMQQTEVPCFEGTPLHPSARDQDPPHPETTSTASCECGSLMSPDGLASPETTAPFFDQHSRDPADNSRVHSPVHSPLMITTPPMDNANTSVPPHNNFRPDGVHPHRRRSSANSAGLMLHFVDCADDEHDNDSAPLTYNTSGHDGSPGLLGFSAISTFSRRNSSHSSHRHHVNSSPSQQHEPALQSGRAFLGLPIVSNPFHNTSSRGSVQAPSGMLSASRVGGTAASFGRSLIALLADAGGNDDMPLPTQPPSGAYSETSSTSGVDTTACSSSTDEQDVPSLGEVDFLHVPALGLPRKFDGFAAPHLIYRVAKGFHIRRRLYLRRLRVRFEKPALKLQRFGRALRARRRLGDHVWALRDARLSIDHWRLRHQSAIRIQCFARKCRAVQRLHIAKRKNQLRVELRVASEMSTSTV